MTQTPKKPPGGKNTIFLFDGNNFVYRAFHALPMLTAPDGRPVNAVHGFVRMLAAARRDFAPERLVAVFDAGGDGGRRDMYPEYKANRSPPPDDLAPQFPLVRQAVDAMGILRIDQPGWEADDIIASYTRVAHAEGITVVIVSSDKDLMQLVSMEDGEAPIFLYDTMKGRVMGPAEVEEKFGVLPPKLGDLLALAGDSSDNIPGVPGIGPKTAAGLLREYGDLEAVLAAAPSVKQKKRRERLIEFADDARLSRKLVKLHEDVPLPIPMDKTIDNGFEEEALVAFFEPLGFRQILQELGVTAAARQQRPSSGGTGSEPDPDSPAAIELRCVEGFTPNDEIVVVAADDDAALRTLLAACTPEARVGLSLATSSSDPLTADLVGLAISVADPDGTTHGPLYLPIGHRQVELTGPRQWSDAGLREMLGPMLADGAVAKSVHDHKHVVLVLERLGITLAGVTVDPMLASYTLDPARASHTLVALADDVLGFAAKLEDKVRGKGKKAKAVEDLDVEVAAAWIGQRSEVTLALGKALREQVSGAGEAATRLLDEIEMPVARILADLERRGIMVDGDVLRAQGAELGQQISAIEDTVEAEVGYRVNLGSPLQLQKLLYEDRGLAPSRKTKTGYSTDAKALEDLAMQDPIVQHILDYRTLTKLKGTYLDTLPEILGEDGRLHAHFAQAVAATGRISSNDPNIQNIPVRTTEGRRIREAFVAPEGRCLVALDYSQIELRVLAHLSGDPSLRSAFDDGVDVHRRTAAEIFSIEADEVTSEQRRIAKAVNFGVVYGQTAFGLKQVLRIPQAKANLYIKRYYERIPGVKRYMEDLIAEARRRDFPRRSWVGDGGSLSWLARERRVGTVSASLATHRFKGARQTSSSLR
ncbi:MAG: DNA polymerase I [Nannocystaceae bacterium]|nr:DNA polymerase I [Nannocystaceae bacterium]